jgi:hypothetical protein
MSVVSGEDSRMALVNLSEESELVPVILRLENAAEGDMCGVGTCT